MAHKHFFGWLVLVLLLLGSQQAYSQQPAAIQWLTFQQLEDSLAVRPKKVFVNFYADWCAYCRKMDQVALQDPQVVQELHETYYAVKMNVETKDTIRFGNQVFVNKRIKKPNPVHEIALLMASRKGKAFSLPAMVVLNEKFEATARYFQYLDTPQLLQILRSGGHKPGG